jgi:hypothetical protein
MAPNRLSRKRAMELCANNESPPNIMPQWCVAIDFRDGRFIYRGLGQAVLRRGILSPHPGERLLHLSEQLTRLRNHVGLAVAFEFGS